MIQEYKYMNKRLGQHFLQNAIALDVIINALQITEGDTIIEIGPGHGELTNVLARRIAHSAHSHERLIAIEKDPEFARVLKNSFSNIEIIEGDVLKILPALCASRFAICPWKLVGNIPYYITGYLFRTIGELAHKPNRAVFTIQKEVAERVCETPPRMNRLAASVQIWAEPNIIMTLAPDNFDPPPTVDSAIIVLNMRNNALSIKEWKIYYRMVRILFRQPRKTIMNNLSLGLPDMSKEKLLALLAGADLNPTARPHNLSIAKIKELIQHLSDDRLISVNKLIP